MMLRGYLADSLICSERLHSPNGPSKYQRHVFGQGKRAYVH